MQALEGAAAPEVARQAVFAAATLKDAALDGDVDGGKLEAGQSAGLIDRIEPAGEVVTRIAREYLAVMESLPHPS